MKKIFKVASVSSNTNSFGLAGHILIAKDGTAFEAGKSLQFAHKKGDIVSVNRLKDKSLDWAGAGFEIPNKLAKPRRALWMKFGRLDKA